MPILSQLHKEIQEKWNFEQVMPIQKEVIPLMLEGKDIVAISPTGTGKTLAYVLPLLQMTDGQKKATQALILSPSQELAMQITEVIRDWGKGLPITVLPLIGGANIARQIERLKKKPTIIVGTPGRVLELIQKGKVKPHELRHIVLDEGDRLLNRENRGLIKEILGAAKPDTQLVLVSATIHEEIETVAERIMKDPVRIAIERDDLPYEGKVVHSFIKVESRKKNDLLRRISHLPGVKALAFVNRMDQAFFKEMKFMQKNSKIRALHSEKGKEDRKRALESLKKGEITVLIATDVAARGLDIKGLTHVIHVDVPLTEEQYLHRSGRTGRAGADGEILSFVTHTEMNLYKQLMKKINIKPTEKVWSNGNLVENHINYRKEKNHGF